ncbi:MAG: phosphoribosyltransferase family protein [Bdellovibrionota bacterium]
MSELEKSELRFRYLFRWIPGASDVLSRYVYLLKSPLAEPLWHELARYFISLKEISINQKRIFIPIPSRKNRKHSLYFAEALAEQCGGVVLPLLSINAFDVIEQKAKNKEQRHKISFSVNEEFTEQLRLGQTLVIVDDVITTGASYEAAYNVLKSRVVCPKNIELWTAFHRESMSIGFE